MFAPAESRQERHLRDVFDSPWIDQRVDAFLRAILERNIISCAETVRVTVAGAQAQESNGAVLALYGPLQHA